MSVDQYSPVGLAGLYQRVSAPLASLTCLARRTGCLVGRHSPGRHCPLPLGSPAGKASIRYSDRRSLPASADE